MAKKTQEIQGEGSPAAPQDWKPEEKLRLVVEARGLTDEELGAFLRKKGSTRRRSTSGGDRALEPVVAQGAKKASAEAKRIRELERELRRKEKALAETAAAGLKKKPRRSGGTRTTTRIRGAADDPGADR